jgi:hypothetical protein
MKPALSIVVSEYLLYSEKFTALSQKEPNTGFKDAIILV